MCLIIDSNIVHKVFLSPDPDYQPLKKALDDRGATLVYGGELRREYLKMAKFIKRLRLLDQSGAAKIFPDALIDSHTGAVVAAGGYKSNDPHVLALAIVTGARLLCSDDDALSDDFKNKKLIDNPRGNVYRRAAHAHLISKHCR
jgi:predicted nucleic acid-binding protein